MPLYTWVCGCGRREDAFAKVEERDAPRRCACNSLSLMTRVLAAPMLRPDIQPYRSPVDGRWVDSRAARREDLKRNNAIEWEPGIRQDLPRRQQENWERTMAPINASVENTVREMVSAGKIDPL